MTVEIVKDVSDKFSGTAVLVRADDKYFVVSSTTPIIGGFETLVFASSETGKVTEWCDVAGGRGMSREEAIADLELRLAEMAR